MVSVSILNCGKSYAQSARQGNSGNVLSGYRSTIDSLDSSLIKLIGAREQVVREVGVYKAKHNIPALQSNRFQEVLNKSIAAGKEEGLSPEFITKLMNLIHDESLKLENEIKNK